MDLGVNKVFRTAKRSKTKIVQRFLYWFMKHYFHCDIHPNDKIDDSVVFAHNALGVVINKDAIIEDNVRIQHHATIGRGSDKGCPIIRRGVEIGAHAVLLGGIEIGENTVIGASAVVTKNVPAGAVVVGNPARVIKG